MKIKEYIQNEFSLELLVYLVWKFLVQPAGTPMPIILHIYIYETCSDMPEMTSCLLLRTPYILKNYLIVCLCTYM